MPLSLGPISRRRFLARSLVAGAGLALSPKLLAAARRTDEHSWALLSDTHLDADRALVSRGINMTDHFTTVSRELLALPKRPAGLFLTGDCAHSKGEPGDYALLAELLKPIREDQVPVHLALGNHDQREHFWATFQDQEKRPLPDRQVALVETQYANWFILDSLDITLSTPGLLGPSQLKWLADALDAHTSKPALVLVHHNPGLNGGNLGLKDTAAFMEVIRPRRQVKAYIYGHTHAWKVERDTSGIHLINLPPVSYVFRDGEPSGWVHATLDRKRLRLELRCIDPKHKDHGQIFNLDWRA